MDHPIVTPGGIHNERHLEEFGGEYMYLGALSRCAVFTWSRLDTPSGPGFMFGQVRK